MPQLLGVGALDGMGINTPDRIIVVTRARRLREHYFERPSC